MTPNGQKKRLGAMNSKHDAWARRKLRALLAQLVMQALLALHRGERL